MPSIFGFMARGPKKRVIARNEMSAGSPANAPPPRRDYLPARHIARGYDLAPTPFTPPERPRIVTLTHAIPTVPEPTAAQPSLPAPALPPSAPQPTSPPAANESQPDTPVPPPALNATTKPPPQPTAPPAAPPVPPAAAIMPANLATPAAAPPPLAPILAPAPTLAPPPSAGLTNSGVVPAARPFFDAAAESQPPITSITTSGVDHGSTIIVFVLIALVGASSAIGLFIFLTKRARKRSKASSARNGASPGGESSSSATYFKFDEKHSSDDDKYYKYEQNKVDKGPSPDTGNAPHATIADHLNAMAYRARLSARVSKATTRRFTAATSVSQSTTATPPVLPSAAEMAARLSSATIAGPAEMRGSGLVQPGMGLAPAPSTGFGEVKPLQVVKTGFGGEVKSVQAPVAAAARMTVFGATMPVRAPSAVRAPSTVRAPSALHLRSPSSPQAISAGGRATSAVRAPSAFRAPSAMTMGSGVGGYQPPRVVEREDEFGGRQTSPTVGKRGTFAGGSPADDSAEWVMVGSDDPGLPEQAVLRAPSSAYTERYSSAYSDRSSSAFSDDMYWPVEEVESDAGGGLRAPR